MYADYSYYTDTYLGRIITSEQDFNYFGGLACDEMNKYAVISTLDTTKESISTDLKRCQCRIGDIVSEASKKAGISSESVNGYYTVAYQVLTTEEVKKQLSDAIRTYLGKYIYRPVRNIIY